MCFKLIKYIFNCRGRKEKVYELIHLEIIER